MSGKVRIAHRFRGYGNCVVVRHYNGLETVYAHLNKICVKVDDEIKAGDSYWSGRKDRSRYGDHLHFEIRFLEQPINPLAFLDFDNYKLKTDTLVITANTFTALSASPNKPRYKSGSRHKKGKSNTSGAIAKNDTSKIKNPKSKIVHHKSDTGTAPPTSNNEHMSTPAHEHISKYYTIKTGDNLYTIAQKNHTTVNKLRQLNGFSKKKVLKVGSKIKLT